jgi:hypothetical protein
MGSHLRILYYMDQHFLVFVNIILMIAVEADTSRQYKEGRSPGTGLEWPRGFQEVKVPRFHDNSIGWW